MKSQTIWLEIFLRYYTRRDGQTDDTTTIRYTYLYNYERNEEKINFKK